MFGTSRSKHPKRGSIGFLGSPQPFPLHGRKRRWPYPPIELPPLLFSPGEQRPRWGLSRNQKYKKAKSTWLQAQPTKPAATPPTSPIAAPTGIEITPLMPSPKTSPVTAIQSADCNLPFGIVLLLLDRPVIPSPNLRETTKFYKLEGRPTCKPTF